MNAPLLNTAKAGSLLCIDSGEYSYYSITGFFVVLNEFNPMEELEKYKAVHPEQAGEYNFKSGQFLAQLLASGFLLEIEYGNLYLGGDDDYSEVSFTP